jgi:hypothetical protein
MKPFKSASASFRLFEGMSKSSRIEDTVDGGIISLGGDCLEKGSKDRETGKENEERRHVKFVSNIHDRSLPLFCIAVVIEEELERERERGMALAFHHAIIARIKLGYRTKCSTYGLMTQEMIKLLALLTSASHSA